MATFTGTPNNDTLNGGGSDDVLDGLSGNDFLWGDDGNDSMIGGSGNDSIDGGPGVDTLDGGNGNDFAYFARDTSAGGLPVKQGVVVNLAAGTATDLWGNSDVLKGIENVYGSYLADTITLGTAVGSTARGSGGNDLITASAEGATFYGGAGNDTLDGGAGFLGSSGANADAANYRDEYDVGGNVLTGKGVNVNLVTGVATDNWGNTDTLIGIEFVTGSRYADQITGGNPANGNDTQTGFEGFDGQEGNDTIDGGIGIDRAQYTGAPAGIVGVLTNGTGMVQDGYGGTDTLISIEEIRGSAFADKLTGSSTSLFESFEGRQGNDTIDGGGVSLGSNRASYQTSPAAVNVTLVNGSGTASDGWSGTDTLLNINAVRGGTVADTIKASGNAINYRLEGREGNDTLIGGDGFDTLQGDGGDDVLDGGAQRVALGAHLTANESNRYDFVDYSSSTSAVTISLGDGTNGTVTGGSLGADKLINIEVVAGSNFNDLITGTNRAINETLRGNRGDDTLDGGGNGGNLLVVNLVQYSTATGGVVVDLVQGKASGADGNDVLIGIDGATGSSFDDVLIGVSTSRDSYLEGRAGNDTITGGSGAADFASYQNASAGVNVDLSQGKSSGADGEDVLSGIEYLRGSEFADTLTGDGLANLIQGRAGNDTIAGGAGDDTLYGGYGVNNLDGGEGTDTAAYVDPIDKFVITRSGATTTVAAIGTSDIDTLVGIERLLFADTTYDIANFNVGTDKTDTLTGTKANDAIYASSGNDTIESNDGDDLLDGGTGADRLVGGRGNDIYIVDDAGDVVVETDNAISAADAGDLAALELGGNIDRVVASIDYTLGSFVENLDLRGGNLKGTGNALGNTVVGSDGNNQILALGGDDRVDGGKGNDTLDGGDGNDTVVFAEGAAAYSFVKDGNNTKVTHLTTGEVDLLINIERIVFSDRSYAAATLTTPGGTTGGGNSGVTSGSASADNLTGTAGADVIDAAEGNDSLSGVDGDDWLIGGTGNDRVAGGKGNDTLDGGEGLDTAAYAGAQASYTTLVTGQYSFSINQTSGTDGSDTLNGIERLEFADAKLAFDLSGNAGSAALLVGVLLGKGGLQNKGTVGAVLGLLDGGQTVVDLCALAVNAGVVASLAGGAGNDKLAALVVKNLTGAADTGLVGVVQGLLDSGAFTPASLLAVATTTDLNKTSVDLVGLAQTGLTYG